ncbi:MAG TPA: M67 family metallopeptidase [Anaerolineales bacterium]|nr:M67 family metallopeptidase [Anaerolineales bacterium]
MAGLIIPADLWGLVQAHAGRCLPEEACGLLAGLDGCVQMCYEITNTLHSATRFRMDAQEQVRAFMDFEQRGLELLAIYHSHPAGPLEPSSTDLVEFAYPGVLYLILTLSAGEWQGRVFVIDKTLVSEVPLQRISA